jgi:hypothetical protein
MKYKLDYVEDQGWSLESDEKILTCLNCARPLYSSFFFCEQTNKAYCKKCEIHNAKRLCGSRDLEHIHHNIIIYKEAKDEK